MKPLLPPDALLTWTRAMADKRPKTMADADLIAALQVESFAPAPMNAGMALRLATRDGQTVDLLLNPVVARHLAHVILVQGQQAGWLTDDLDVTSPPLPHLDA